MKQLFLIFSACILALALGGCGSKEAETAKDSPSSSTQSHKEGGILTREDKTDEKATEKPAADDTAATNPVTDITDFNSLVSSANRNNLTADQIAQLEADGEENGYKIQWAEDGSMILVEDNGNTVALNGDWPDNEFTKAVPRPNLPITASTTEESSFFAIFGETSKEDLKAYAEELIKAGFTQEADTQEQSFGGMDIYSYTAQNSDGLCIELVYTGTQNVLSISK